MVAVSDTEYDATTSSGRYSYIPGYFEAAANCGVVSWRGNAALAFAFATALGASFGGETIAQNCGGPYFACNIQEVDVMF